MNLLCLRSSPLVLHLCDSDGVETHNACALRYEAGKKEGMYSVEEAKREHAKHSLERYMHYFQRWSENDKSRLAVRVQPCV